MKGTRLERCFLVADECRNAMFVLCCVRTVRFVLARGHLVASELPVGEETASFGRIRPFACLGIASLDKIPSVGVNPRGKHHKLKGCTKRFSCSNRRKDECKARKEKKFWPLT